MEVHFFMTKLTREQKIKIYEQRNDGMSISSLSKKYGVTSSRIDYLCSLISLHGYDILRKNENRYYSVERKQEIIDKVLIDGQSIYSTSIEYGLSSPGMLCNWIRSYKENGYVIVEKKRGRYSTMPKKSKQEKINKPYDEMSDQEKIDYLEKELVYKNATIDYLKKLSVVMEEFNKKDQQRNK